jgi:NAD(P)-dependent dehydrogenase (short-subunit alcohol dehydrogenase family)
VTPTPGRCERMVAVVTGASRGIGAALAMALAAEGANVACVARTVAAGPTLPGSLDETVATITSAGGQALAVRCDLADADARAHLIAGIVERIGPVDILVNNAAALVHGEPSDLSLKRRRLMFEVNVQAPIDLAQAVVPAMRERGRGWILNITSAEADHRSVGGDTHGWASTGYGASKAALDRYTNGLAGELAGSGVAVHALAPDAAVRTPATDAFLGDLHERRPDLFEPMERFVAAALALVTADPGTGTGRVTRTSSVLSDPIST